MATKRNELANPAGCLNRAEHDEPIFVLRANDPQAPKAIRAWASHYFDEKGGLERMSHRQRAKYYEALALADDMDGWRMMRNPQEFHRALDLPIATAFPISPGLEANLVLERVAKDAMLGGAGIMRQTYQPDEAVKLPPGVKPGDVQLKGARFCGVTRGCIHYAGHTGACQGEGTTETDFGAAGFQVSPGGN